MLGWLWLAVDGVKPVQGPSGLDIALRRVTKLFTVSPQPKVMLGELWWKETAVSSTYAGRETKLTVENLLVSLFGLPRTIL
jgi:hypothetical protein